MELYTTEIQARYTEVLYNIMRHPEGRQALEQALSTYPLYVAVSEQKYGIPNIIPTREVLNKKILDHYKYYEIAFETPGRFLDELEIAMNEIMPTYNQLMFSADQDYDIKFNVDYKRTIERQKQGENSNNASVNAVMDSTNNTNGQASSTSEGETSTVASDETETTAAVNNNNKHVESLTPQNDISVANTGIDSVSYADKIEWNKDTNSDTGTSSGASESTTTNEVTGSSTNSSSSADHGTSSTATAQTGSDSEEETTEERTFGNYGATTTQSLIEAYRSLIVNIEQQIINDPRIKELFMTIY